MGKYQLTISPNYIPSWGCNEALRELVQNGIDRENEAPECRFFINYDPLARRLILGNPDTSDDFLEKRRIIFIKHHTDKGAKTDSGEFTKIVDMFKLIKDNYDYVNGFINTGVSKELRTRTGELITELGNGLGDLINGCTCERCNHKGYTVQKVPIYGKSSNVCDCEFGFIMSAPCRACNGTGIFHTRSGFNVRCPKCSNKHFNIFHYLFGYEEIIGYKEELHLCYICNGKGEIPISNPVFQKGSMSLGLVSKSKYKGEDNISKLKRFNKIMTKK
jgi:hypothetical protein